MINMDSEQNKNNGVLSSLFASLPLKYKLIVIGIGIGLIFIMMLILIISFSGESFDEDLQDNPKVAYANKLCSITTPLEGYTVTSIYGYRQAKSEYGSDFHEGIDLAASYGTPVYSATNGYVIGVENSISSGYGRHIEILSEDGTVITKYAHLSAISVKAGDKVTTETAIGNVGGSGLGSEHAYGAHLHFEYMEKNEYNNGFVKVSPNNLFGYTDIEDCVNKKLFTSKKLKEDCNISSSRLMTEEEIAAYKTSCYDYEPLADVTDCPTNEIGIRIVDCPTLINEEDSVNFPGGYTESNGLRIAKDFISMEDYVKVATYNYLGGEITRQNIEAVKFFMIAVKSRLWNQALSGQGNIQLKENEIWVPVANCYEDFNWDIYKKYIEEEERLILNASYDAISDNLIYDSKNKVNNSIYGNNLAEKVVSMAQQNYPYQAMISNPLIKDSISEDVSNPEEENSDEFKYYKNAKFVKCHWENQATQ